MLAWVQSKAYIIPQKFSVSTKILHVLNNSQKAHYIRLIRVWRRAKTKAAQSRAVNIVQAK